MLPIGVVWQTVLENPLINLMVLLTVLSFGSYGVAILIFTILTRVVTFPLTLRTLRAARGLQELQPDMEAIQKRYKDPKRRSEEQMKLYRRKTLTCEGAGVASAVLGSPVECDWKAQDTNKDELIKEYERHLSRVHSVELSDAPGRVANRARKSIRGGVNPLGCLGPQLIQFPIFIGLYIVIRTTLSQHPEDVLKLQDRLYDFQILQSAMPFDTGFLAMDLSSNGNLILVVVIFASMWLTQRISSARSLSRPGSQQAQMNQMMQWMLPAMFGWFALVVPAGLGLYWAASTLIGLVLQWVFVGPGDFTWGSLIPNLVRARVGMSPLSATAGAAGRGASAPARAADDEDETPEAATAGANGETAQTGETDDGRRGQRSNSRRRRRSGARQTRGQPRQRRRRGDSRR
jgi:YidC/Oxa1 family membrane protein insertase